MGALDYGARSYLQRSSLLNPGPGNVGLPTGFLENLNAAAEDFDFSYLSTSEAKNLGPVIDQQLRQIHQSQNPDVRFRPGYSEEEPGLSLLQKGTLMALTALPTNIMIAKSMTEDGELPWTYEYRKESFRDLTPLILQLREKYPNDGLKTYDEILADARNESQKIKEKLETITGNRTWGGVAGQLVGVMKSALTDPYVLASMTLGTGKITGASKGMNALRAFIREFLIGAGSETLIQPFVMDWQAKLENPWTIKQAAITILTVGGFAGVARAGGSYTIDLLEAGKAASTLRARGETAKADVLDSYIDLYQNAPKARDVLDSEAHIKAISEVQTAADGGRIISQSEIDKIIPQAGVETIDPTTIRVDAETFQFKARGDEEGVTDALKGVTKWDEHQAGVVMVWERNDGVRFVVDGHQRLALAKRLISEGSPAEEINLNAFILREADGITPAMARERAAIVNIGQGTGTAIDAAKILRAAGSEGRTFIDNLPPNAALVRDARGLAKLDDLSFRMIIDDMIEERYGAIVGDLVKDGANQAAVIRALSKAKPQNLTQARSMVMDMNAAGFEKVKTDDLFGGVEFSESLIKERAQVLDSMIKRIKKDKAVFKTLSEQEARISGAGENVLDRAANLQRLTSDELALATLTALANSKGPVSDAINKAASKLKSGSSLQEATKGIIPTVKQAIKDGGIERTVKTEAEIGKAVRLQDLDEAAKETAELQFRSKQRESIKTIDDLFENAVAHQKLLNQIGRKIKKETGIAYKPPPFRAAKDQIKSRARVKEKVEGKYGGHYHQITDIVRASFVIERTAEVSRIIKRLQKEFEILDEGFNHSAGNYLDRKVLVRFKDGRIGEIQIIEKNFYNAKFNQGGVNLYYKWRNIDKVKEPEKWKLALKEMEDLYGAALNRSNLEWKTLSETLLASEKTSLKLTSRQGSPGSALEKAVADSGPSTKTAGMPSHQAKPVTLSQSNKSIDPIIRQDPETVYLNDPKLKEIMDSEVIEAQRIIDDFGEEFDVPFTLIDDLGKEVTTVQAVRRVFDDIDNDEKTIGDLFKCMRAA